MNLNDFKRDVTRYKATYILALFTTIVWLWQFISFGSAATSGINLFNAGALFGPAIVQDPTQLWRLVTPIFVHIGWMHFLMNMLTLVFIGRQIETIFGSLRFTAIYILAGVFGNAMTFLLTPNTLSAGASTSLFGLFAAVAGLGFFTGHPFLRQIGKTFAVLIVANLLFNTFDLSTINIWGHIGGALGGALLSAIFPPKAFRPSIPEHYRWFSVIAFVFLLIAFVGLPFVR
ncbi:MAG: rhomboid family intramembrane serine protease [Streptococcaceae bacterium]|nr:rhomboid family intramembrane serine protease [Streptococcaceae bacterium]